MAGLRDGVLNGDTAEEVWNLCNDKLQHDPKLTVRGLIEQSNVAFIGTTDVWQSAYSEYYFTDVLWPDFGPEELDKAIAAFNRRNRRFGGAK